IADDNNDSADILAKLLELEGHEVHAVYSGTAAFAEIDSFLPQIAILDIGMPDLNGYELARLIRAKPYGKTMFLIALTGWGQADDQRRAAEAGFNRHLIKPPNFETLKTILLEFSGIRPEIC